MNGHRALLNDNFSIINKRRQENDRKYMKINLMNMNNNYYINQQGNNNVNNFISYPSKNMYEFDNNQYDPYSKSNINEKKFIQLKQDFQNLKYKINNLNNMLHKSRDKNMYNYNVNNSNNNYNMMPNNNIKNIRSSNNIRKNINYVRHNNNYMNNFNDNNYDIGNDQNDINDDLFLSDYNQEFQANSMKKMTKNRQRNLSQNILNNNNNIKYFPKRKLNSNISDYYPENDYNEIDSVFNENNNVNLYNNKSYSLNKNSNNIYDLPQYNYNNINLNGLYNNNNYNNYNSIKKINNNGNIITKKKNIPFTMYKQNLNKNSIKNKLLHNDSQELSELADELIGTFNVDSNTEEMGTIFNSRVKEDLNKEKYNNNDIIRKSKSEKINCNKNNNNNKIKNTNLNNIYFNNLNKKLDKDRQQNNNSNILNNKNGVGLSNITWKNKEEKMKYISQKSLTPNESMKKIEVENVNQTCNHLKENQGNFN
jgi:hypothetical protein